VLDKQTAVKPGDSIPKDFFEDAVSNVVQYGPIACHAIINHKWYYFPALQKDEAIIFKQVDSDWIKQGHICFHMSINNPKVQK
jgi:hypothetical protein